VAHALAPLAFWRWDACGAWILRSRSAGKSFLVLFFKKELLSSGVFVKARTLQMGLGSLDRHAARAARDDERGDDGGG
jgi:hypothetical protein